TTDGTIPREHASGNRRAASAYVRRLGLARSAISWSSRSDGGVIPVKHRPAVEELRNRNRNPLRRVAGIRKWRLSCRIESVLLDQVRKRKILAATGRRIKRVWSVQIVYANIVSSCNVQSFVNRPSKVLAATCHHFE